MQLNYLGKRRRVDDDTIEHNKKVKEVVRLSKMQDYPEHENMTLRLTIGIVKEKLEKLKKKQEKIRDCKVIMNYSDGTRKEYYYSKEARTQAKETIKDLEEIIHDL